MLLSIITIPLLISQFVTDRGRVAWDVLTLSLLMRHVLRVKLEIELEVVALVVSRSSVIVSGALMHAVGQVHRFLALHSQLSVLLSLLHSQLSVHEQ